MSWMDSWSRPSKHSAIPPPLYLTVLGGREHAVSYCHTCGRVIGPRKSHANTKSATPLKYCSDRCRHHRPGPVDRRIEAVFLALLEGASADELVAASTPPANGGDGLVATAKVKLTEAQLAAQGKAKNARRKEKVKGDPRVVVDCSGVEEIVFGARFDPEKVFGRRKDRASRVIGGVEREWRSVDMESDDEEGASVPSSVDVRSGGEGGVAIDIGEDEGEGSVEGGVRLAQTDAESGEGKAKGPVIRPPQTASEVNGSIGGEKGWAERVEETPDMLEKRRQGQRRAEEREMVRRAARRGCAFGLGVKKNATSGDGTASKGDGQQLSDNEIPEGKRRGRRKEVDYEDSGRESLQNASRLCEAVMDGVAVEASFAKGDFGIRFRER